MSQFTEIIRQTIKGGTSVRPDVNVIVTTTTTTDPHHDCDVRLDVNLGAGISVRPNEKPQMIEDTLLERITCEVYGDVRVRLDEFIRDRGLADEATEELEAIVEMMR